MLYITTTAVVQYLFGDGMKKSRLILYSILAIALASAIAFQMGWFHGIDGASFGINHSTELSSINEDETSKLDNRTVYDFVWRGSVVKPLLNPPCFNKLSADDVFQIQDKLRLYLQTMTRRDVDSPLYTAELYFAVESYGSCDILVVTHYPMRNTDRELLKNLATEAQRLYERSLGILKPGTEEYEKAINEMGKK